MILKKKIFLDQVRKTILTPTKNRNRIESKEQHIASNNVGNKVPAELLLEIYIHYNQTVKATQNNTQINTQYTPHNENSQNKKSKISYFFIPHSITR